MLGELIYEGHGKVGAARVLDEHGKVEVSDQESGKLIGMEVTTWVTFLAVPRPDGTIWGDGQGSSTTRDGEFVTWKGHGIGRLTGKGNAASWRGTLYFQNASPKLARLLKTPAVYEYESDENGNTHIKAWEWK